MSSMPPFFSSKHLSIPCNRNETTQYLHDLIRNADMGRSRRDDYVIIKDLGHSSMARWNRKTRWLVPTCNSSLPRLNVLIEISSPVILVLVSDHMPLHVEFDGLPLIGKEDYFPLEL